MILHWCTGVSTGGGSWADRRVVVGGHVKAPDVCGCWKIDAIFISIRFVFIYCSV